MAFSSSSLACCSISALSLRSADVLRKDRTDAVAVGTDKSEQETQSKNPNQQTEVYEEQTEEKSRQSESHGPSESKGNKSKDESPKTETKVTTDPSPMLKQFYELKSKHPDTILLFRCGDFYETYSNDAEKAAKILGITLSKSNHTKDAEGKPLMIAGFPHHALDVYLPKLIRAGERIAICDQLETPRQEKDVTEKQKNESDNQEENKVSRMHR